MPPKIATSTKDNTIVPAKRKPEADQEGTPAADTKIISLQEDSDSASSLEMSKPVDRQKKAAVARASTPAKRNFLSSILEPLDPRTSTSTPDSATEVKTSIEIKPSIEANPPAKRPRKATAPTRPQLHALGTQAFARPFVSGTAAVKQTKVLVTITDYKWCERSKQWQCHVETEGSLLPLGTEMWLPEKALDAGFKVGELLSVKVNGGWCEGEVVGRTVEGDDGWGYEVEVIGVVRAAAKDLKTLSEEGKLKYEKTKAEKVEVKDEF